MRGAVEDVEGRTRYAPGTAILDHARMTSSAMPTRLAVSGVISIAYAISMRNPATCLRGSEHQIDLHLGRGDDAQVKEVEEVVGLGNDLAKDVVRCFYLQGSQVGDDGFLELGVEHLACFSPHRALNHDQCISSRFVGGKYRMMRRRRSTPSPFYHGSASD
jgi:hypothetical protein